MIALGLFSLQNEQITRTDFCQSIQGGRVGFEPRPCLLPKGACGWLIGRGRLVRVGRIFNWVIHDQWNGRGALLPSAGVLHAERTSGRYMRYKSLDVFGEMRRPKYRHVI